jgi:transcriptional regulator with XRE-family HTH domain
MDMAGQQTMRKERMSRQRIQIDLNRVEELAAQGLSQAEICATLGISEDTLTRRKRDSADFAEALKRGKAKAAATVSNKLFKLAKAGNLSAIIWWEKTRQGYFDRLRSEVVEKRPKTFKEWMQHYEQCMGEPLTFSDWMAAIEKTERQSGDMVVVHSPIDPELVTGPAPDVAKA